MADPSEFPRKTLDDIRRELDAAYPLESEAKTPDLVAEDDDAGARRYLTITALAGAGALLLLIVGYVVMSLAPMPNALASARAIRAPNGAAADPDREPREVRPVRRTGGTREEAASARARPARRAAGPPPRPAQRSSALTAACMTSVGAWTPGNHRSRAAAP